MTPELTKAAQQALEVLKTYRDAYNQAWVPGMDILEPDGDKAIDELESTLTQRPAAQEVEYSNQLTKAKRLLVDLHKIGGTEVRSMIEARTGSWFVWGAGSLPAHPPAGHAISFHRCCRSVDCARGSCCNAGRQGSWAHRWHRHPSGHA